MCTDDCAIFQKIMENFLLEAKGLICFLDEISVTESTGSRF